MKYCKDCKFFIDNGYPYYTYRDNEIMNSLMNFGLMKHIDITDDYGEKMIYFVLTDFGKNVALSMVPEYD